MRAHPVPGPSATGSPHSNLLSSPSGRVLAAEHFSCRPTPLKMAVGRGAKQGTNEANPAQMADRIGGGPGKCGERRHGRLTGGQSARTKPPWDRRTDPWRRQGGASGTSGARAVRARMKPPGRPPGERRERSHRGRHRARQWLMLRRRALSGPKATQVKAVGDSTPPTMRLPAEPVRKASRHRLKSGRIWLALRESPARLKMAAATGRCRGTR